MTSRWKQFLLGRTGVDPFSMFLLLASLVLQFIGRLFGFFPLVLPAYVLLIYGVFRIFSANRYKRQVENARFLSLGQSVLRWFRLKRSVFSDKDHRYFKCPNCGQPLRVPRGKGKIQVTCRTCGAHFEEKS